MHRFASIYGIIFHVYLVFSVTVLPEQGKIVQVEAGCSSRTVVNRGCKYYCKIVSGEHSKLEFISLIPD